VKIPIFYKKVRLIREILVTLSAEFEKTEKTTIKKQEKKKWQQLEKSEVGDLSSSLFWQ